MNNPIDSRQVLAFVTLAKTGSFTQTGKSLSLSQSAVSHSVKALEQDLGCALFDRVGKKILLTTAGEQFLPHAKRLLEEMNLAREKVKRIQDWGAAQLRICASTTACQYILPGVLKEYQQTFPKVQVSIQPGDTLQAMELLREKRVDCAVCLEPPSDPSFEFLPLFTDELLFVVGADHSWAKQGAVKRAEIHTQNYVLYAKGTKTFALIQDYFFRERIEIKTVMELHSMEAIKELVKLGIGISILAPWIARKEIAEKSLHAFPLGKRKLQRHWGILYPRSVSLSLRETHFVSLCRRACGGFSEDAHPQAVTAPSVPARMA